MNNINIRAYGRGHPKVSHFPKRVVLNVKWRVSELYMKVSYKLSTHTDV
jgi:hypothetical protein